MRYKIDIEQSSTWSTVARYTWTLWIWLDTPNLMTQENWHYIDSGDSKYKWNAKRSAHRAMKRHKKQGDLVEELVWSREYE